MENTLVNSREKTLKLVQVSMVIAVLIALDLTGLGFIKFPMASFTTMHIPVIVGAIVLGPVYGGIFGGTMGVISMLEATFKGTGPVDLAFSPFYSGSPFSSVLMSVVVRIFIGVVAGLVFRAMIKSNVNSYISMVVAAFLATATNTVGVLSCLWLLFPSLGINFKIFIEAIITLNFVFELILAIVFSLGFAKALPALKKYMKK